MTLPRLDRIEAELERYAAQVLSETLGGRVRQPCTCERHRYEGQRRWWCLEHHDTSRWDPEPVFGSAVAQWEGENASVSA